MKNLLAFLCIAYTLFISAESLQCKSCINRNGKTCEEEESVECEDASQCVSVAGFLRFNTTKYPFIQKGCPTDLKCSQWLCITSDGLDFQAFVSCCQEENCDSEYYIPDDDIAENCVTCPYCYEEGNLDGCKSDTKVKCRGDDTLCVEYRGRIQKPDGEKTDVSFKNCANTVGFTHLSAFSGFKEIEQKRFQLIDPIEVALKGSGVWVNK